MYAVQNGTSKGNVIYCSALFFFIDKKKKKKKKKKFFWYAYLAWFAAHILRYYLRVVVAAVEQHIGKRRTVVLYAVVQYARTLRHGTPYTHTHERAHTQTAAWLGVNGPTELLDRGRNGREYYCNSPFSDDGSLLKTLATETNSLAVYLFVSSAVFELSPWVTRKSCFNHEFDTAVSPFWKRRRTQHQTADIDPIGAVRGTPRPATTADTPPRPAHAIAQCRKRDCDVSLLRISGRRLPSAGTSAAARSAAF